MTSLLGVAGDDVPGGRAADIVEVVLVGVIADPHAVRLELLGQDVEPLGVVRATSPLGLVFAGSSQGTDHVLVAQDLVEFERGGQLVVGEVRHLRVRAAADQAVGRRASCGCPWPCDHSSPRTRHPGSPSSRPARARRAGPSPPLCGPSRPAGPPGILPPFAILLLSSSFMQPRRPQSERPRDAVVARKPRRDRLELLACIFMLLHLMVTHVDPVSAADPSPEFST